MSSPVVQVNEDTSLADLSQTLGQQAISCVAVVGASGKLSGVVSRTDLLRHARSGAADAAGVPDGAAAEVMTRDVVSLAPSDQVATAARQMVKHKIHRVFVCEDGKPVGVISTKDIMRAVAEKRMGGPIGDLMRGSLVVVKAADPVSLAVDRMAASHKSGLVVKDGDWPVGVFTQREALLASGMPPDTAVEQVMNASILCLPAELPVHRAVAQALAMNVRRVLVMNELGLAGILTGLDLAAVAQPG